MSPPNLFHHPHDAVAHIAAGAAKGQGPRIGAKTVGASKVARLDLALVAAMTAGHVQHHPVARSFAQCIYVYRHVRMIEHNVNAGKIGPPYLRSRQTKPVDDQMSQMGLVQA